MNLAKHSSTENRNKYYPIKLKRTKKQIKILLFLNKGNGYPYPKIYSILMRSFIYAINYCNIC